MAGKLSRETEEWQRNYVSSELRELCLGTHRNRLETSTPGYRVPRPGLKERESEHRRRILGKFLGRLQLSELWKSQ